MRVWADSGVRRSGEGKGEGEGGGHIPTKPQLRSKTVLNESYVVRDSELEWLGEKKEEGGGGSEGGMQGTVRRGRC